MRPETTALWSGVSPGRESASATTATNGTVTDNLTGLIWLRNANCTDSSGGIAKLNGYLPWANALTWSNNLSSGRCGLSDGSRAGDWRLPNVEELDSLLDLERYGPSLPSVHPFSNVQASPYWSSNGVAGIAWYVVVSVGYVGNGYAKASSIYVWPVRSGQSGGLGSLGITDASGNAIGTRVAGALFDLKVTGYTSSGTPITGSVSLSSYGGITPMSIYLANGIWNGQVKLTEVASLTSVTASHSSGVTGSSNSFAVTGTGGNTSAISGKVLDNFDGPVSAATVNLSPTPDGLPAYSTTTNSSGYYSINNVQGGQYYIWATQIISGKASQKIIKYLPAGRPVSAQALVIDLYSSSTEIPVVLVPGMLGSSAKYGGLHAHPRFTQPTYHKLSDLHLHDPGKGFGVLDRSPGWRDLKNALNNRVKYVDAPWDWRMPLGQAVNEYLIPAIDRALQNSPTGKVNIIAHSMGGLLVRAYIQSSAYPYRNDIENFSMVGTPNLGSGNSVLSRKN